MIAERALQLFVATARHRRREGTGVAAGSDRIVIIDFVRQDSTGSVRLHFERRDEKDKAQSRIDGKPLWLPTAGDDEAAKLRRRGVIRMAFELGAEAENFRASQRAIEQRVQAVEHAQPHGHTAAEPAGARHFAVDRTREWKRRAAGGLEKFPRRLLRHRAGFLRARAGNGDVVVKSQGHAKAIETGAEIRSSRGNAHRDLLLFQMNSSEVVSGKAMAALTLTCSHPAARFP